MPKTEKAIITPELLIWARESLGFSEEDAAKKINVKVEKLIEWEKGESNPTINQLYKIADIYKRPTALFYLPKPPDEKLPMGDYRRLPSGSSHKSPVLMYDIRKAFQKRKIALDLLDELGDSPIQFSLSIDKNLSIENEAARIRKELSIQEELHKCKNEYGALNLWKKSFEDKGIMVFQTYSVSIEEMRGFCLAEFPMPVIVLNAKDTPFGRIFTLLHELSHLLQRNESGICDLDDRKEIEILCNKLAGNILVPKNELEEEIKGVENENDAREWSDSELSILSKKFWVSKEVILRRLLCLHRTTQEFYEKKRNQYLDSYQKMNKEKKSYSPPVFRMKMSEHGIYFSKLILNAYHCEKITGSDVSEFLDMKLQHLPKMENAIWNKGE